MEDDWGKEAEMGVAVFEKSVADDGWFCRDKRPLISFSSWIGWWWRVGRRYAYIPFGVAGYGLMHYCRASKRGKRVG